MHFYWQSIVKLVKHVYLYKSRVEGKLARGQTSIINMLATDSAAVTQIAGRHTKLRLLRQRETNLE